MYCGIVGFRGRSSLKESGRIFPAMSMDAQRPNRPGSELDQGLGVEEDSCGYQGKAKVAPPIRCVWGYACDGGPSIHEDHLIVTFASS